MKRGLMILAGVLGLGAGGMALFPQSAPFAPLVQLSSQLVQSGASQLPDPCPDAVCWRDPRDGKAGRIGTIALDGGASCECE